VAPWYVPAGHSEHEVDASTAEKYPAAHAEQLVDAFEGAAFPLSQTEKCRLSVVELFR